MDPLTLTLLAISSIGTAFTQKVAGEARENQLKRQAEQEKFKASTEELQRRERLKKILAANAVASQVSGIKGEGTPASIALESAKNVSMSEQIIGASERLRQRSLLAAGKSAKYTGRLQAASTLLSGAYTAKKSGAFD